MKDRGMGAIRFFAVMLAAAMLTLTACSTLRMGSAGSEETVQQPDTKQGKLIERLLEDPNLRVQLLGDGETILVQMRSGDSFQSDSVFPTKILEGVLDHVASVLTSSGGRYKVKAVGYTDNVGSQQANMQASERRAMIVASHLISKGLNQKLVSHEGRGSQEPIADNETQEGRDVNRRVDLLIRQCVSLICSAE
jgi:outer membrane protein OmpA-like peptidoglycan-associated protein